MLNRSVVFLTWLLTGILLLPAVSCAQDKAPSFHETDIRGNRQSPDQYLGKTLVLYFWASWCPNCRKDVKKMIAVYKKHHAQNVEWISISLDHELEKLESFAAKMNIPYPILFDGRGWENQIGRMYGISAIPVFFVVDSRGFMAHSGSRGSELDEILSSSR